MRVPSLLFTALFLLGFTADKADVSGWSFVVSKDAETGVSTVTMPVRDGVTAIAFTLRPGSCMGNDCENDRERIELKQAQYQTEGETWWYGWSIYVPEEFVSIWPGRTFLGQFHQEGGPPAMLFSLEPTGLVFETRFARGAEPVLIPARALKGRWHDIAVEVKWSKSSGHVKIEIDGVTLVDRAQQTMSEDRVYFKFGIYRAHLSRAALQRLPVQTVIYDRLRRASSKDEIMR